MKIYTSLSAKYRFITCTIREDKLKPKVPYQAPLVLSSLLIWTLVLVYTLLL